MNFSDRLVEGKSILVARYERLAVSKTSDFNKCTSLLHEPRSIKPEWLFKYKTPPQIVENSIQYEM